MSVYVDMANAQFENVNELRRYPFTDESSLKDDFGMELPDDCISDVRIVVPSYSCMDGSDSESSADEGSQAFRKCGLPTVRMSSFHMSHYMVSACFVICGEGSSGALSVTVSSDNFRPYFPYRLEKVAGARNVGGVVTFGNIEFPMTPHTYFLNDAVVHPCCVAVSEVGRLRSVVDRRSGNSLTGDISVDFSGYVNAVKGSDGVKLLLEDGAADELASECAKISGYGSCGATPIRSINGIRPDEDGNIVIWFH